MSKEVAIRHIVLFEEKRRSRTLWLTIAISAFLHLGTMLLISAFRPAAHRSTEELIQVSVYDITRRPEVAKVVPKQELTGGGGFGPTGTDQLSYTPSAPAEGPTIDLKTALERNPSQAKIDLNRYELDRSGAMDVVYLGGQGSSQSTEEILSQPAIALTRARSGSSGPARGLPGVPRQEPQLTIEHRPLAKTPARTLPEPLPTQTVPEVSAPVTSGTRFEVAGPISQRPILNKQVPKYPAWALQRRISGSVTVRIWVLPSGKVKGTPTVEVSSGYPDLDQVVVNALKNWEFAPLDPNVKAEDQWGLITFRFTLS